MLNIFLFKSICHISMYFVFLGLVSDMAYLQSAHFGTAAVLLIILLISFFFREKPLPWRLAPLPLIAVMTPFANFSDVIYIFLPFLVYAVYIAASESYTIHEGSFKNVAFIGILYLIVTGYLSARSSSAGAEFILVALVSGVLLARDVRHDIETVEEPAYMAVNLGIIGAAVGFALFVGTGFMRRMLTALLQAAGQLYLNLMGPSSDYPPILFFEYIFILMGGQGSGGAVRPALFENLPIHRFSPPAWLTVYVVISFSLFAIVAAALIFLGLRALKRLFAASGKQNEGQVYMREKLVVHTLAKKPPSVKLSGYSGAVRRYYQRFIKLLEKSGVRLFPNYTSQDMEGFALKKLGDDGQDLRDIYLRARYSDDTITRKDSHQARDAYRRMKDTFY